MSTALDQRETDLALATVHGNRAAHHVDGFRQLVASLRRELGQGGQELGSLGQLFGIRGVSQQEFGNRGVHNRSLA